MNRFDTNDIASITANLRSVRAYARIDKLDTIDVRLQAADHTNWAIYTGDACYDTDHSGHCGSASVAFDDTDDQLGDIAADLVDQVEESAMQADELDTE